MADVKRLPAQLPPGVHAGLRIHAVRNGLSMPEAVGQILEIGLRAAPAR